MERAWSRRDEHANRTVFYCGTFEADEFDGKGVYYDEVKKEKYEGECRDGMREGTGELTSQRGEFHYGEWREDLFEGRGSLSKRPVEKFGQALFIPDADKTDADLGLK